MSDRALITQDWLRDVGFKWEQFDRQPGKQWILWLGRALRDDAEPNGRMFSGPDDVGIELASGSWRGRPNWSCWLRSDVSHRYSRFLHVRYLMFQDEVTALVEAITGYPWNPANHIYGQVWTTEHAERLLAERNRLDRRLAEAAPWYEHEKDPDRAKALPEHIDAARKGGFAK